MSLYVPDIRSEKPEVRSGHICLTFRGNIFIWGGFNDNVSELKIRSVILIFINYFLYIFIYLLAIEYIIYNRKSHHLYELNQLNLVIGTGIQKLDTCELQRRSHSLDLLCIVFITINVHFVSPFLYKICYYM